MLYGEEDDELSDGSVRRIKAFGLEDKNLDAFDPYGLDDF